MAFSSLEAGIRAVQGPLLRVPMKSQSKRRNCLHCRELFAPDHRNRARQRYCSKPDCQRASKRASQARWVRKNTAYFTGRDNVERVRRWRAAHPGYWKRAGKKKSAPLQDPCPAPQAPKPLGPPAVEAAARAASSTSPLQDLCSTQTALLVGLVAQMIASALPEDIDRTMRLLIAKGSDILDQPSRRLTKGNLL